MLEIHERIWIIYTIQGVFVWVDLQPRRIIILEAKKFCLESTWKKLSEKNMSPIFFLSIWVFYRSDKNDFRKWKNRYKTSSVDSYCSKFFRRWGSIIYQLKLIYANTLQMCNLQIRKQEVFCRFWYVKYNLG